jgi:hypothetical protein
MSKFFAAFVLVIAGYSVGAQDTLKFLTYNLLNFPSASPNRVDTLEKILHYNLPDVFIVNELESTFGADLILNNALNELGVTTYARANFVNGTDTDNMLYYNTVKVGLKSQKQISTSLRDITEYKIYYKSTDLATNPDTIYMHVYSCHLKAGSTTSDEVDRNNEAQFLKQRLGYVMPENCMVGGDFNIYRNSESAYTTITTANGYALYDPINRPGIWNNNAVFKDIHTQSTRETSFDGGSTGGMDDRFDWWFVNANVLSGTEQVKYISGSYAALGQDGLRFNNDMITPLSNAKVPSSIGRALYYMSDHLPLYMEVLVGREVGIGAAPVTSSGCTFRNMEGTTLLVESLSGEGNAVVQIYDLTGKLIVEKALRQATEMMDLQELNRGVYLITVVKDGGATGSAFRFVRY